MNSKIHWKKLLFVEIDYVHITRFNLYPVFPEENV